MIERNDPGRFDKLEETACPPPKDNAMLRLDYLDRDALARIAVQASQQPRYTPSLWDRWPPPPPLTPSFPPSPLCLVQEAWDDRDEARWIAKRVADYYHHHQALHHNTNHKQQPSAPPAGGVLSRVAVLVRKEDDALLA